MAIPEPLQPTSDTVSKLTGPGRPKDLSKRAAILEAAKHLFIRHGFDGVSMDQIAAEAGVSKLTIYSHFGDKESLFSAGVCAKCEEQLPSALFLQETEGPLREQLLAIARAFFALVTSEDAIAMHRMMMMPGTGGDHIRALFWQAGPQRLQDGFCEFLRHHVARGELVVPEPQRAASQFFCLLKGDMHAQMMCGMCCQPGEAEIEAHLAATVEMFLRAYGPCPGAEVTGQ
ncbi:MAG: TetR/AcrR family transcriptional regulator [Lysobacteraceae bacterium]|nr:MAG: TetR/AcrR family transcriptional regulator [Xanthomonadaceae bacterium]